MRHAAFRRFVAARGVSTAGSWMQTVAVGVLAAIAKGPSLLATPFGGWLADRTDRRRLTVRLSIVQVVPSALLAVFSIGGDLTVWEIYGLVLLGAVPTALIAPVLTEIAPTLVPEPERRHAMADSAAVYNIARLVGPAIGGALVTAVGVAAAFALNAASFLVVAVVLRSVSAMVDQPEPAAADSAPSKLRTGLTVGWRSILLRTLLASTLTFFAVVGPLEQVMPAIAAQHGDSAGFIGLLLASLAAGGLLANPLVRHLDDRHAPELLVLGVALVTAGVLLAALAISSQLALNIVTILLIGGCWEVVWVVTMTTVHFRSPTGASGAVMGVLFAVSRLAVSAGSIGVGWAFDQLGITPSLLGSGVLLVLFGVGAVLRMHRRLHLTR
jgi:predicted MFS family arabinose efflux permease